MQQLANELGLDGLQEIGRLFNLFPHGYLEVGLAIIATFVLEGVLLSRKMFFPAIYHAKEYQIEKAKQNGHIVPAQKIAVEKVEKRDSDGRRYYRTVAIYEYQLDGVTRVIRVDAKSQQLPDQLDFYYKRTPEKLFCEYNYKDRPTGCLFYGIPMLVGWLVILLTGVDLSAILQ